MKRLLLLACLSAGCHLTWVKRIDLNLSVLNDHNELLVVEGQCNLPDDAILEARLRDKGGRRWAYGQGRVQAGRYYVVLEISRCPGFRPLDLDVYFDPIAASAKVQRVTGDLGQALAGPYVVESKGRALIMRQKKVMLTMSARQMRIRKLVAGDGDVDDLHSYLVRHPNDAESLIGLGLAYLKQRPSQHYVNSEAYKMLKDGLLQKPTATALEMEARLWIARLDDKERREREERERQKAPSYHARFQDEHLIRPGQAVGAFQLGMPYQFLAVSFKLVATDQPTVFELQDFPGLRLTLSQPYGSVVAIATRDERFHTQEGIHPGSELSELLAVLPDTQVDFGDRETRADGRVYDFATVRLAGVRLLIERSYDPMLPIPRPVISEIEVVKPDP